MFPLTALLLAASQASAPSEAPPAAAIEVLVVVPLCDGRALACGNGSLGDPRSLDGNLYWGALYGAERFLAKAPGFRVLARTDAPDATRPAILRETTVELAVERAASAGGRTGARAVRMRLQAWDGTRIDEALAAFLAEARAPTVDLVVWAGHDRLMDVAAPSTPPSTPPATVAQNVRRGAPADAHVAVLACESAKYFGPVLDELGATSVALTRTFMAPEAYLLEALARSVAAHGMDRPRVRDALVAAYAKYQRISTKAAGTVFTRLE